VRRIDTIFCAVIPGGLPGLHHDLALRAREGRTRSSVVLGLVGAGGIGLELKVAMDLFDYPTRFATIILDDLRPGGGIVEQAGNYTRKSRCWYRIIDRQ
jgi:phosphonate transport system permease protein